MVTRAKRVWSGGEPQTPDLQLVGEPAAHREAGVDGKRAAGVEWPAGDSPKARAPVTADGPTRLPADQSRPRPVSTGRSGVVHRYADNESNNVTGTAMIVLEIAGLVSLVTLGVAAVAMVAYADRGLGSRVRAVYRRRRPPELKGDWWPRFEDEFRAYAGRVSRPSHTDHPRAKIQKIPPARPPTAPTRKSPPAA